MREVVREENARIRERLFQQGQVVRGTEAADGEQGPASGRRCELVISGVGDRRRQDLREAVMDRLAQPKRDRLGVGARPQPRCVESPECRPNGRGVLAIQRTEASRRSDPERENAWVYVPGAFILDRGGIGPKE